MSNSIIRPSWLQTIHHDGSEKYVSILYPRIGEQVRIRIRAGKDAPVRRIILRTLPDGEQVFALMQQGEASATANWWQIDLTIEAPITHYRFILECDDGIWWYTATGAVNYDPLDNTDFRILGDYNAPDWLQTAVFYQIFPDRFADGDSSTNPDNALAWEQSPAPDADFPTVFYGGDLDGICQKLPYLQELGINALYLNPIFTAYSNHKYDVADFMQIDPHFGGDDALIALRGALDERDMRYILDIVPNHCGYSHHWFQAARVSLDAPEAEFFTFHNHPDEYESWLGVWSLPKLNYNSLELRRRLYKSSDAVFRHWLKPPYAADGWRVDVANMLGRQGSTQIGHKISRGIRKAVKKTAPNAYLMGENFFDATSQLQGNEWDGVMNYTGFIEPLWHWLKGYKRGAHHFVGEVVSPIEWPTTAVNAAWQSRRASIAWGIAVQQYNLIGSHDVSRIRTMTGGNDALHRLATTIMLTFPGVPSLYYGDEIGMEDAPSLEARGCMIWDDSRWNHDLLAFHKQLIALRKGSQTLQRGGFQMLLTEVDTLAYQREGVGGRFIIIAHRGEQPRPAAPLPLHHADITDGATFTEFFSGQQLTVIDGTLPLLALPQGATLWVENQG